MWGRRVWSEECGGGECGVRSVGRRVWSVGRRVWSVGEESGVWGRRVWSVECGVCVREFINIAHLIDDEDCHTDSTDEW